MIDPIASVGASTTPASKDSAKLKKSAEQLEGVFVQQLYKAMRDTVPQQDGIVSGGAGEDIFTGLMDQHLAAETPKHWEGGLSDALYRQLSRRAAPQATVAFDAPNTDTTAH